MPFNISHEHFYDMTISFITRAFVEMLQNELGSAKNYKDNLRQEKFEVVNLQNGKTVTVG